MSSLKLFSPLHYSTTASHDMMYTGKFIYDSTVVIFRHLADNYCAHKICLNILLDIHSFQMNSSWKICMYLLLFRHLWYVWWYDQKKLNCSILYSMVFEPLSHIFGSKKIVLHTSIYLCTYLLRKKALKNHPQYFLRLHNNVSRERVQCHPLMIDSTKWGHWLKRTDILFVHFR